MVKAKLEGMGGCQNNTCGAHSFSGRWSELGLSGVHTHPNQNGKMSHVSQWDASGVAVCTEAHNSHGAGMTNTCQHPGVSIGTVRDTPIDQARVQQP